MLNNILHKENDFLELDTQSDSTSFPVKILSFVLMLYIASVIVFKQNYIEVTYVVNGIFFLSYVFMNFMKRDLRFRFDFTVLAYTLFATMAFVSSLWAMDFDLASLKGMQLFLITINAFIIYDVMSKYTYVHNAFMKGVFLGSVVNYLFILGIVAAPFEVFHNIGGRAMGTLGNANVLALTMVISILSSMVYLYKEKSLSRIFSIFLYLNIFFAAYIILLTASKKGIIFGVGLIFIYILLQVKDIKRLFNLIFVTGVLTLAFLNFADLDSLAQSFTQATGRFEAFESELQGGNRTGSTAERLRFIEVGLSHFSEAPFIGHGIDTFRILEGTYSHNNYIEILFGLGMIGVVLFYTIYIIVLRTVLYVKDIYLKIILIAVIFNSLLVDVARISYDDKMAIYLLLFISVLAEQYDGRKLQRQS